jgi:hypothetical protein
MKTPTSTRSAKPAAPKKASTSETKKSEPMAKTDVAKTAAGSTALSTGADMVPDFMREFAGQGTDQISNSEVETPRLKLLQAISPEIEMFDGAKVGGFWHSISEENLGSEVSITIIMVDQRYILWKPRWEGGGILARADDGVHWNPANQKFEVQPVKGVRTKVVWETKDTVAASGLAEWGSSQPEDPNSQPAATKMFNLLVAFNDRPDLGFGIVTLQRAGVKVARKLLGKLKITAAPSFGMKFIMSSTEEEGQEGPYRNYAFRADGFHDADTFKVMKEAHDRFKKTGINIKDLEGAQEEGGLGDGGTGDGGAAPKGGLAY